MRELTKFECVIIASVVSIIVTWTVLSFWVNWVMGLLLKIYGQ